MLLTAMRLIIVFTYVLLSVTSSYGEEALDPYKLERSLRYPNSYDIHVHTIGPYNIWQIDYKVNLLYPSKDILAFYDDHLGVLGWTPFAEENYEASYRVWQTFIDDTKKGSPRVHQLIAKWRKEGTLIFVGIRYYSSNVEANKSSPDSDVEEVFMQIMPFIPIPPLPRTDSGN